jgi:hypothetical protein
MKLFIIYVNFIALPSFKFCFRRRHSPRHSVPKYFPQMFPDNYFRSVLHLQRETMQEKRKIVVFVHFYIYVFGRYISLAD